MRSRRSLLLLALFAGAMLLWSAVAPSQAQGTANTVGVSADYELFGTSQLNGGGHVTWTLTGTPAQALRADMVHLFDEYPQIPRGFTFAGAATSGNGDGTLQVAEGFAYTDHLENELEGTARATLGTRLGYFYLDRSDLFDKDPTGGFQRSTSGIVGTSANSTQDMQIRFLFNGYSNTPAVAMAIPTRAYADALFDVFAFNAEQSPTYTAQAGYDAAWPLTLDSGWHVLRYNATAYAMWPGVLATCPTGNVTTCRYAANTESNATTDIGYANGTAPWVDLRFASSAWVTFAYTGTVATPLDRLVLEAAPGPSYSSWTPLPNATWSTAQNTTLDTWASASVNLSAYLGQKVLLRLAFDAGSGLTDRGFFVRDFAIHAPSTYTGEVVQNDAHYLIGTLSFSSPNVPDGGLTVIRTPGGEILFDNLAWDTSAAPPPDTIQFDTFNAAENPQILFVIMVAAAYFVSRLQEDAFDAYKEAHPGPYRAAVHKVKWLHWVGKAAILVLVLFYFVPTAFFAIGLRVFVSGPAYWFLAAALVGFIGLGTRTYYRQLLEESPPPSVRAPEPQAAEAAADEGAAPAEEPPAPATAPVGHCTQCLKPIVEDDKTYTCTCGALYHLGCASSLMRCSSCRKPIAVETAPQQAISMRCQACGEVQSVPQGVDPRTVTCSACGGALRALDAGKRYLLLAANPALAFNWMKDLTKGSKPALCISPASPERLEMEFGLKGVQFLQVADGVRGALEPKKLDPAGLKAILPLAREGKGGVLLYDGLEEIIARSSLSDVVRFLRKANDMAFVHGVTVIARVGPGVLKEDDVKILAEDFDETLDLSARL